MFVQCCVTDMADKQTFSEVLNTRERYYGGAESSYSQIIRKIQNDPRLSKSRKAELCNEVSHLVNHIICDADFMIRNRYGSAHSSGIKYLKFRNWDRPAAWIERLFYEPLRSVYANATLESLGLLHNLKGRIRKTAQRLDESNDAN